MREEAIFAFEACDIAMAPTTRGRIVRFDRAGDRITKAGVIIDGLDNGCHQIDFIDVCLTVLDTQHQRVLRFASSGQSPDPIHPLGRMAERAWSRGYAHINSLLQVEDRILMLLHNGFAYTGNRVKSCSSISTGARSIAGRCPATIATISSYWRMAR